MTDPRLVQIIEEIAAQWDGCEYDAPGGMIDIGDAIRRAGLPKVHSLARSMEKEQGWRPIESAPKEIVAKFDRNQYGPYFLAYCQRREAIRCRWWQTDSGACNFLGDGGYAIFPSHWMPLPPAPVSQEVKHVR